jgi:hypothetical protein
VVLTKCDPVPVVIERDLLSGCIFPERPENMILEFPISSAKPREGGSSIEMSLADAAKKGL